MSSRCLPKACFVGSLLFFGRRTYLKISRFGDEPNLAVTFIMRNQEHLTAALASYQHDAATLLVSELTVRAEGNQSFNTLAVLWPSLSILATAIALVFARRPTVTGVCLGLVAVFMGTFLLDFFAFRATNDYLAHLQSAVAVSR